MAVASVDSSPETAERMQDEGVDILLLSGSGEKLVQSVRDHVSALNVPVIAGTSSAQIAGECLGVGASAIDAGVLSDPMLLQVVHDATASIVVGSSALSETEAGLAIAVERARWAQAAGLSPSQIMVRVSAAQIHQVAGVGFTVVIDSPDEDPGLQGVHVVAAMAGARVMQSHAVRATKRTVSTVGELLQRRGVSTPGGVELLGST